MYSVVILLHHLNAIPVFLSISVSLLPPFHICICMCFSTSFFLAHLSFTEWVTATVWGMEQAYLIVYSLQNGCPISWLLGLLIGAGRRESRGPIGVLGWTLSLEGMVCDADRQCDMSHKYTSWQGSYCYYPSGLTEAQWLITSRSIWHNPLGVRHINVKHFHEELYLIFVQKN